MPRITRAVAWMGMNPTYLWVFSQQRGSGRARTALIAHAKRDLDIFRISKYISNPSAHFNRSSTSCSLILKFCQLHRHQVEEAELNRDYYQRFDTPNTYEVNSGCDGPVVNITLPKTPSFFGLPMSIFKNA